jgi:hypothetical protein
MAKDERGFAHGSVARGRTLGTRFADRATSDGIMARFAARGAG